MKYCLFQLQNQNAPWISPKVKQSFFLCLYSHTIRLEIISFYINNPILNSIIHEIAWNETSQFPYKIFVIPSGCFEYMTRKDTAIDILIYIKLNDFPCEVTSFWQTLTNDSIMWHVLFTNSWSIVPFFFRDHIYLLYASSQVRCYKNIYSSNTNNLLLSCKLSQLL